MNIVSTYPPKMHAVYKRMFSIFTLIALIIAMSFVAIVFTGFQANAAPTDNVSVIKRAEPIYPNYAIKNGIEGAVLINFSIEKDGNVSDIEVVASDHDGLFDGNAILGVQKWAYTKPTKKRRNNYVSIEFVLTNSPAITKYANVEIIQVKGN